MEKNSTLCFKSMGIPQGSVPGPLIFSMYINNLPERCPVVGWQMYADDTVIYTSGKTTSKATDKLTVSLYSILQWLKSSH